MRIPSVLSLVAAAALVVLPPAVLVSVEAAVPGTVSFQGRLTDGVNQPVDTTVDITFKLYAASSGGASLWTETHAAVTVNDGLFEVLLGDLVPLNRTILDGTTRWLSMTVGSEVESTSRLPITSTAYALRAQYTDTANRAAYADTAGFALGVGNSGWVDDGTKVRLTTLTDQVGIGTATPMDKLHVDNSAYMGASRLLIRTSHATNWAEASLRIQTPQNLWHFRMDDYTNNDMPDGALSLRSQDLGSEVMTWTSDGKVGILNTLPEYPLDVRSSAVAIYGRTTGGYGLAGVYGRAEDLGFGVMGTSSNGRGVYGASTTGYGGYFLGPKTYVSGNLGIGVESPTHKLHVAGNTKVDGTITAEGMMSTSITDEPGVASVRTSESILTNSWQSVCSRQINVPGAGYVVAIGSSRITLNHNYGVFDGGHLGLSESSDTSTAGILALMYADVTNESGYYDESMTASHIFEVASAGPRTYYLVAKKAGPAQAYANDNLLCLIYVPTSYGTVSAAAEESMRETPSELQRNSRIPAGSEGNTPDMQDVMKELAALRQEVEALKAEKR